MTIDGNFTERLVEYEGYDTLSNEDYNYSGQSVTQHCKLCRTCTCDPSEHYLIDYELGQKRCDDLSNSSQNHMTNMLDNLCQASAEFSHILLGLVGVSQNDSFLSGFKRMLKEEDDNYTKKSSY
ncbi:unnamed protein product [Rotaria sp. Silwood2]|nr:unnamed protein product [Rotaria sp. Silwood2]